MLQQLALTQQKGLRSQRGSARMIWWPEGGRLLGSIGCLQHKVTSPRLRNITNLPKHKNKHRELNKIKRRIYSTWSSKTKPQGKKKKNWNKEQYQGEFKNTNDHKNTQQIQERTYECSEKFIKTEKYKEEPNKSEEHNNWYLKLTRRTYW